MQHTIIVHVDESDLEFLETPASKSQIEQAIYRTIQILKEAHYDKASRMRDTGSFRGTAK
jgi:hypothetical protein